MEPSQAKIPKTAAVEPDAADKPAPKPFAPTPFVFTGFTAPKTAGGGDGAAKPSSFAAAGKTGGGWREAVRTDAVCVHWLQARLPTPSARLGSGATAATTDGKKTDKAMLQGCEPRCLFLCRQRTLRPDNLLRSTCLNFEVQLSADFRRSLQRNKLTRVLLPRTLAVSPTPQVPESVPQTEPEPEPEPAMTDVDCFLEQLGLSQYRRALALEEMDMSALKLCRVPDLEDLGLSTVDAATVVEFLTDEPDESARKAAPELTGPMEQFDASEVLRWLVTVDRG
eukprot:SAG22_NODE_2950_length_2081_cov_2.078708_1_plen_281_part_00